jgi:hypothetical protein
MPTDEYRINARIGDPESPPPSLLNCAERNRPVTLTSQPHREDIADRGDEIYERKILPRLGPSDQGKFVLIDVRTADYEVDQDEIAASDRLLARRPDAQVWMRQVGSPYARRFGPRFAKAAA